MNFHCSFRMPPKGKRKAADQDGASGSKQAKNDGQNSVSKTPNVPIDEGFVSHKTEGGDQYRILHE